MLTVVAARSSCKDQACVHLAHSCVKPLLRFSKSLPNANQRLALQMTKPHDLALIISLSEHILGSTGRLVRVA